MKILIRIILCGTCVFIGYIATMMWVNISEGNDAFLGTPFEGRIDSAFVKKAVDFTSEQFEKLSRESEKESIQSQNAKREDIESQQVAKIETPEVKMQKGSIVQDSLEKVLASDNEKSADSKNNTLGSSRKADESLMNNLQRLMN